MARVESLGIHTPLALPYLIREGILPREPKRHLFQWETYVLDDAGEKVEEELLITKTAVAWSQGTFIRHVYRFDLEGEDVNQAVLTSFPPPSTTPGHGLTGIANDHGSARTAPRSWSRQRRTKTTADVVSGGQKPEETLERALVVLLKTKAHVHFIHGAHYIVDLPFEVAAVFPAPRGIVVQRRAPQSSLVPPTPQMPSAPHNSFFSSQILPSSSYLQSPTLVKSFASTPPPRPSPSGGSNGQLEALYHNILQSSAKSDEADDALLYSLTDPFSDFGVISTSVQNQRPRLSGRAQSGFSVELEPLDPGEGIIYVSQGDELCARTNKTLGTLMLMVTANKDLQILTVWHAWYIEDRSLSSLMKQRAANKAAKLRRRSSFLSASIGTGVTTPLVRHREPTRESFAAGALRLAGESTASHITSGVSRQPTREEEEEVMASQMDPDYKKLASQQPLRESRRISSMNTESRASQNVPGPGFTATGNRRHTSFGTHNNRRSLSHRKSRASTPGSVFSRSIGPEDDVMDLDSTLGDDRDESVAEILMHMRATFEAVGTDNVFGSADEVFKRDLVVRKLHCLPMDSRKSSPGSATVAARVVTLKQTEPMPDNEDTRLNVYVHDTTTKILVCLQLAIKQRPLSPGMPDSIQVAVPVVIGDHSVGSCSDVIKISDGGVESILMEGRGLLLSTHDSIPLSLPPSAPYRVYDPRDIVPPRTPVDKDFGRNRTLPKPSGVLLLSNSGIRGSFDEVTQDGTHHRRRLQLRPFKRQIDDLLQVCQVVLPRHRAATIRKTWCAAYCWLLQHPEDLAGTASEVEWVAFVTAVLANATHLLGAKARAALQVSRLALGRRRSSVDTPPPAGKTRQGRRLSSGSTWLWTGGSEIVSAAMHRTSPNTRAQVDRRKDHLLTIAAALADELTISTMTASSSDYSSFYTPLKLMLGLHIQREEQKLSTLTSSSNTATSLAPVIAQLGNWLGFHAWSFDTSGYYKHDDPILEQWTFISNSAGPSAAIEFMDEPEGVFQWLDLGLKQRSTKRYPSLANIALLGSGHLPTTAFESVANGRAPRLAALSDVLVGTNGFLAPPAVIIKAMSNCGISAEVLESFPGAIAAPFREAVARCERKPPTTWSKSLLQLVGRDDLDLEGRSNVHSAATNHVLSLVGPRDAQTVCNAVEQDSHLGKTKEASRHAVSQLIFSEDRRLVDAFNVMHFNGVQTAECPKQPEWSDAQHFEQQRRVMQFVTLRMIALPVGDGMIHFDSQFPLLTERYYLPGFNSSCLMQPMGHTLTTDRTGLTEEKVNWAYFHAGVSTGLRISRNVQGIDTSWVAFNKPADLTNRYAGLLLALGLSGHLRSLAKWLSFKYLTPKHNMTSVGLLLGLSASYMGTMDSLITRMLSVHITRMLPAGAAELNVSPITQTAGLMGVGLLFYNTQHRRMSEIMLSEIEFIGEEDPDGGPDPLRDESYRLAAGFALGFINLGKGKDLRGLHGMQLPERLLAISVGPRPVSAVHVFDRATAGAVIAIALVYMKTGDRAIARKIDIPDTEAQYDHVRPDMLVLRAMAKHLVLWDDIRVSGPCQSREPAWIKENLPSCYRGRFQEILSQPGRFTLNTRDVPFYNIATGLAWAVSLKYAGSGDEHARDEILAVLETFYAVKSGEVYYYDAKLARSTIRRCIDVLALSAATVMAGTGDLKTFRYLRRLHGRTDADTPYGSHMAAHLAIGVLFLGGGTYTLGTSDLAIAALICAFYPLFPTDVHDNRVHLQAFRHLWVLAAEARCLVIEDIDTQRPLSMAISVTLHGSAVKHMQAPCLLPELSTIATIHTTDPSFWRVTLDFASNPAHLEAFRKNQRIYVRRCPASEGHSSAFSTMLAALNDAQRTSPQAVSSQLWHTVLNLPAFVELDKADIELLLPPDVHSAVHLDERGTMVDDMLVLGKATTSRDRNALWNLRLLFSWADRAREGGEENRLQWIDTEVIEALKARIEERTRRARDR